VIGDQLELFPPGEVGAGASAPWGGRCPRELTRAFQAFSFGREGMGRLDLGASHVGDFENTGAQIELPFPFTQRGE